MPLPTSIGRGRGISPWDAGMIPVPEPTVGWLLMFGAVGLVGLSTFKGFA